MNTRFYHPIADGDAQTRFDRAYPRGRDRFPPAERHGRSRQQSMPEQGTSTSMGRGDTRYSAPPAPRASEKASGSGLARPTTPPKTPPKAPPRDPGTYLSPQDFEDIREGRYGRFDAAPRAKAARSRSPKQRPFSEAVIPGKVAPSRVRPATADPSTASSHEAPPKAKVRTMTPPQQKAPPVPKVRPPPPAPTATSSTTTEGRGPKAGTVNRPAAIVPPPEKAGQPTPVLGGTAGGTFYTMRGEPIHPVPLSAAAKAAAPVIIPKAMPTDADTRPNNVDASRQATAMTDMFRIIQEAHDNFGTPLSSYPNSNAGDRIDPAVLPLNNYNRVDQYVWAVLRARNSPEIIRNDFVALVLPNVNTRRGFVQCGAAEVIWFLRGWNFYERDAAGNWRWRY